MARRYTAGLLPLLDDLVVAPKCFRCDCELPEGRSAKKNRNEATSDWGVIAQVSKCLGVVEVEAYALCIDCASAITNFLAGGSLQPKMPTGMSPTLLEVVEGVRAMPEQIETFDEQWRKAMRSGNKDQ